MSPRVRPNNYDAQGKMCRGHDTAIFAIPYLILLTLWFHKTFKLIFLNQSSWPKTMHAEYSRKLAWATFMGNFPKLLVQQFSMLLCFQSKISFPGYFDFSFWFNSAILFSKKKSLFLNPYTNSLWVTSLLQLPITTGSVY